jgi:hypothetical protein
MIFFQLTQQMQALQQLLFVLSNEQYTYKVDHLSKASIGGHTRHVIELLQCAIYGYSIGKVDYVNRKRNLPLTIHSLVITAACNSSVNCVEVKVVKFICFTSAKQAKA